MTGLPGRRNRASGAARPAVVAAILMASAAVGGGLAVGFVLQRHPPPVPICRPGAVAEAPAPPEPPQWSGPLRMRLSAGGTVSALTEAGRAAPLLGTRGGFSIRPVGGSPDLVRNPGFEADANADGEPDGWAIAPGAGTIGPDGTVAHSGNRSVRISLGTTGVSGSVSTRLPVRPDTYYTASAWFRGQGVLPTSVTAYRDTGVVRSPLQLEIQQLRRGSVVASSVAYGYTNTAGWNRQFAGFLTGPGVTSVRVAGRIVHGSGTAWIDDVAVSALFRTGPEPFTGGVRPVRGGQDFLGRARSTVLGLHATVRSFGPAVRVNGMLSESAAGTDVDAAGQVTFTLPLDARGWRWGDYARRARTITAGRYSYESQTSLQTTSRYPWNAVWNSRFAIGVGLPLDEPRMFRVRYVTGVGLAISFDLGVGSGEAPPRPASFSFVLYPFDPAWGFRSATQAYYDLFPGFFARHTRPACEGAWFVAPPLDTIEDTYRRFGLGLDMIALGKASSQRHDTWGTRYLRWDNDRAIATAAYNHHWAYYDPVASTPTYDRALAQLRAEAATPPRSDEQGRLRDEAGAALVSTARDYNGRLYYERYQGYLAYYQNLDPELERPDDWSRAVGRQQVQRALAVAAQAGGTLNAIHLDSTSGMRRWGAADDYDRDHWDHASQPLTFSYDSGLVVERGVFPIYDDIQATANLVRSRGMFLSANYNADENRTLGFVGANLIDYFGLEQGLEDRTPTGVTTDQFALMKRSLADQRPVSTLDHRIGDGQLGPVQIDRRLQTNLFYGIFSGAFRDRTEADASGGEATWSTKENASLWGRYTPIFRALAEAGWHPVTDARSSNPAVWVERFGSLQGDDLHLTVRNPTDRPQSATISLAPPPPSSSSPGPSIPAGLRAVEEVTGAEQRIGHEGGGAQVTLSIPPLSTRVLSFSSPAP